MPARTQPSDEVKADVDDKGTPEKDTDAPPAPATDEEKWAALVAPFPADWIEKLPKQVSRDDAQKGSCREGTRFSADGVYCGGWHARSVHLDYVGHAGITMRLNEAVGPAGWSWEPLATDSDGLPMIEKGSGGEFWIKLTILGVTKYGVGDDYGRSSKQAIGDALRNAAMRFGIGTYLWSKSDMAHNLSSFTDRDTEPTIDLDALVARVRESWNHPTGMRVVQREVQRAGALTHEVTLADGRQQLGDVIANRLTELDAMEAEQRQAQQQQRDQSTGDKGDPPTSGDTAAAGAGQSDAEKLRAAADARAAADHAGEGQS